MKHEISEAIKESLTNQIHWYEKQRTGCCAKYVYDVKISRSGKNKNAIVIYLRNGIHKNITNTEYMRFGVLHDRMFFIPSNEKEGWRLYSPTKSKSDKYRTIRACVPFEEAGQFKKFEGEYMIEFDKYYQCYYIDVERKGVVDE